jgi:hypothetical protein
MANMITTPAPHANMRWGDVVTWLKDNGYSGFEIRRMLEKGVIEPHYIKPFGKNAWYSAQQITQVLNGTEKKEN